jgi:hypothetical protein
MLESYLQMFAKLRTDKGRDRYPEITYHRAPHKPFLLISVMDLIAQGRITENLIEPSCAARRHIQYLLDDHYAGWSDYQHGLSVSPAKDRGVLASCSQSGI